jgi:protease IV
VDDQPSTFPDEGVTEPKAEGTAPASPPQPTPGGPTGTTFGSGPAASATTFSASSASGAQFGAPTASYAPPPPAPARRGSGMNWGAFFGGALFGCGCLPLAAFVLFVTSITALIPKGASGPREDAVGLIDVSGVITSGSADGSPFEASGAGAQTIIDQLEQARTSNRIKSVVLWINSPGGSAAGSDAVYTEVQKVRTSGKKVIVAMGDVAASGGYYIASAADRIYANGATITGSIGVISEIPNYSDPKGWIKKSGFDAVVVKSGKYKDMGNPLRPMTRDEKALFQEMVDDIYNQFLNAVSKARKMDVARLRPLADGRVFTGRQAVKLGLIDKIGTLGDAIAYAGEQGNLGPEPKVHKLGKSTLSRLLGDTDSMYQGVAQRKLLGLMLLDPRVAAIAKEMAGMSGQLETR